MLQAALEKALREIRRACIQLALSQSLPGAEALKEVSKPGPAVSSSSTPGEGTTVIMRRDAVQRLENATLCDMEE